MAASDAAPGLVNLSGLMDDAKCFAFVRQHRWPEGVRCPRAIRFSENVVADIREWTSTWGRRALDFGGRAGYHDFNQI